MAGERRIHVDNRSRSIERQILAVAEMQHTMIHRRQLLSLGLHPSAIDRRVAAGRLHVMHHGVYALGHRVVTLRGRWMAAVLACGHGAVLSHRDAAALLGLRPPSGQLMEVTARGAHEREGIHAYRHAFPPARSPRSTTSRPRRGRAR